MSRSSRRRVGSQEVPSNARGKRFLIPLVAAWPIGILIGLVVAILLGGGAAVGVASGLSVALGLSFVWVAVTFAIDDGDVDEQVHDEARAMAQAAHDPAARSLGRVVQETPEPDAHSRGRVVREEAGPGARSRGRVVQDALERSARAAQAGADHPRP